MSTSTEFKFSATLRNQLGTAHSRRLRRNSQVPAVVYGAGKAPQSLTLEHKEVSKLLGHEEVFSQIVALEVGSEVDQVVIKNIARHHTKPIINHIDFLRISADAQITMHIPIHFVGEQDSPGVKAGGVVSHLLNDIEVKCLPAKLPQSIEVDIAQLEIEHALHLSDITLPSGVEFSAEISEEHNPTVVSIHHPHVEADKEEETASGDADATADDNTDAEKTDAAEEPKK